MFQEIFKKMYVKRLFLYLILFYITFYRLVLMLQGIVFYSLGAVIAKFLCRMFLLQLLELPEVSEKTIITCLTNFDNGAL